MIKREHIKQAIDAISNRNPEIGYSLDEMLGMGVIDVPSRSDDASTEDDLFFLFEGDRVLVNRVLFFDEGTVPIEQGLLIKYGELVKRQELEDGKEPIKFPDALREIHAAGLRLAVTHEIDRTIACIGKRLAGLEGEGDERKATFYSGLVEFLEQTKRDDQSLQIDDRDSVFYRGVVDDETLAYFTCFPICMDSLMQVADINVEFFSVRFILNCLIRGLEKNLMACIVDRNVVGLIYLNLREQFLKKDLEIKFLATLRGKTGDETFAGRRALKGVGTFLVAGVWLLWKNELLDVKELVLDTEVGARGFYEAVGFQSRGLSGYVLKQPKGYLLKSILVMTTHCRNLRQGVIKEIEKHIQRQVKGLRKRAKSNKEISERKLRLAIAKQCLSPNAHPSFGRTALSTLLKHEKKIPESAELIHFAFENASEEVKAHFQHATGTRY
ncbi:MAG: hypothetical protein PVG99_13265 [Desulfobacteraceae bacterium]|jgi:hypothetical protein